MPGHTATVSNEPAALRAGGNPVESEAAACELLAAALAACARDTVEALIKRQGGGRLCIEVHFPDDAQQPARISIDMDSPDAPLRGKVERALRRCPVARRLALEPIIDWTA